MKNDEWREMARLMVDRQLRSRGIDDARVLEGMQSVPRHRFVPVEDLDRAYSDHALPTAEGQTISQPYMVALMTELLDVQPGSRVLEVGTGSGYQSAILLLLGAKLATIDLSGVLSASAQATLTRLAVDLPLPGLGEVEFVVGDGTLGHAPKAPYDRILVTAAAPSLPNAYREQTADGGKVVVPVGGRDEQALMVYERRGEDWRTTRSIGCRFVPLVGEQGWPN